MSSHENLTTGGLNNTKPIIQFIRYLTSAYPTLATTSWRQFPQANYNVALDEARRHLGHHELTSLLHKLTGHDPSKSGYTRTDIVLNALAKALGRLKELKCVFW